MSQSSTQAIDQTTPALQSPFPARQARLAGVLQAAGLDALALNPGPSLTYFTGLSFHLMERPVVAVFTPGNPVCLVIPELETAKTEALPYPVQLFPYGEDPAAWSQVFRQAALAAGLDGKQVGVEPLRLRVMELRFLEGAAPQASYLSAESCLAALRMSKDENELAAMRQAVKIAQDALLATLPMIHIGVTEREIAAELSLQLLRHGSDPEFPFMPIVSSGPNSANPHASPSQRALAAGDMLVIDWGAAYRGYLSDLTRTFAIGEVDEELKRIHDIVRAANAAALAVVAPGVPAQEVDRAARKVIETAGYGRYFFHRTGHGLGMEGHEPPYMREGNTQLLEVGQTFTIEPGIYLTGRNGVRIEDDVVVTESGGESLSDLPRPLQVIGE